MPLDVVEGWTAQIQLILKADGTRVIFSSTGDTPELILKNRYGTVFSTSGDVAWAFASCGVVGYTPGVKDLLAAGSPYVARFKVTDSGNKIVFFPNGAPDKWTVWPP